MIIDESGVYISERCYDNRDAAADDARHVADKEKAQSIYYEMLADYWTNGGNHSSYFSLSKKNIYEGSKETITVKYSDLSEHKYNFYGSRSISFILGTSNTAPGVVIGD